MSRIDARTARRLAEIRRNARPLPDPLTRTQRLDSACAVCRRRLLMADLVLGHACPGARS